MEKTFNLIHSTRIVGLGHVAAKILGYIDEVDADKLVFLFDAGEENGEPWIFESEILVRRLNLGISCPTPREKNVRRYIELIEETNLLASVMTGADCVVFLTALPSMGGFVLAELAGKLAGNPLFNNVSTTAFLQMPFKFEGKTRTTSAKNLHQVIKGNMTETKVMCMDDVMRKDGYLLQSIEETFKHGEKEIAQEIKNYIQLKIAGDYSCDEVRVKMLNDD